MDHYILECLGCQKHYQDSNEGFLLHCKENHSPALLRARYSARQLSVREDNPGIFRYRDWLPVHRNHSSNNKPVVFRSEALSHHLGLSNLLIAFNGYWPERDAYFETGTFKELEALAVTARIPDSEQRVMVVSSAGNTGMAFLQVCSEKDIPLMVLVPASALPSMWMTQNKHPSVSIAVVEGRADYLDCIELASSIAERDEFYPEGGVMNVARRDGMGTVILAAAELTGQIPDHYFQAIGSGTGGIAAWEASNRLMEDGRFGNQKMRLHLVQNKPFSIIADAWEQAAPELFPLDEEMARIRIEEVYAHILSNRRPPYAIKGGVYDALKDTQGFAYAVTNDEAKEAGNLFQKLEGCDIHPAAAVAVAGLCQAVAMGRVPKNNSILLNITGGGAQKLEREGRKIPLEPDIVFTADDISTQRVTAKLRDFLKAIRI